MGQRDLNIFPLYGQQVMTGALDAPLFPSNGARLLAGAIGADAQAGHGVTGSSASATTTLSASAAASSASVTLTSATGYAIGNVVQIDVNASVGPTTAECRKITAISTNTIALDVPVSYAHSAGASVSVVIAPYTHTIVQGNVLPSFSVEKAVGGWESILFGGVRVNKFDLKCQTTNTEATFTADVLAKSASVVPIPTAATVVNESPFVFAEGTITLWANTVAQVTNVNLSVENGAKGVYTFNGGHTPQFVPTLTRKITGTLDVVFTSLDDATWGYYNQMLTQTEGNLSLAFTHPSNAGSATVTCNKVRLAKYADALKMTDEVISTLSFEAHLDLTASPVQTIGATIVNAIYLSL